MNRGTSADYWKDKDMCPRTIISVKKEMYQTFVHWKLR